MKLIFSINYHTDWGESVCLTGSLTGLCPGADGQVLKMEPHGSQTWRAELDLPDDINYFEYRYIIRKDGITVREEWGKNHQFQTGPGSETYQIFDSWQDQPADKPYYSSAFTDCICRRTQRNHSLDIQKGSIYLKISAPLIKPDQVLAVTGSPDALGAWDPQKALILNDCNYPVWEINIARNGLPDWFQYKFLILDKNTRNVVAWEDRDNRTFDYRLADQTDVVMVTGLRFVNPQPLWRGAGTAIPVFSIRTENDYGVGDFYDLKPLVDWAVATGQTVIQLLPINDTTMSHTWTDSYPYNANSTFALHPMYLRLTELGRLDNAARQAEYDALGKELNSLATVDYERVNKAKLNFIREIYAQEGNKTITSTEFKRFVTDNKHWLTPYAAFCVLRDRYHTANFRTWPTHSTYDPSAIAVFEAENKQDMELVYFTQYHLDKQMREVRAYANAHGVALKGDIPIGISRDSVDAWVDPRLFNLDCQAGAPPDDFSVLGQNWGFPTYNWDEMSLDGFQWWRARMQKMAEYFDAFRIDHVLGFFRIWQIPLNTHHGLLGLFYPALPYSPDELRYNYDFWLDPESHTVPYITDEAIKDLLGEECTDEAILKFLEPTGNGHYAFKPEFSSQRKITDYFASQPTDEETQKLYDALLCLHDQVLFIEDPIDTGKYHPRISAQQTYAYRSLTDYEKWTFDKLHEDFYYHRHNDFWLTKAMWKLPPILDATNMLVCAEDLGMIPACVPTVMEQLKILSLEIQRMPKEFGVRFGNIDKYPYLSVCTTSTHDMSGIRQWWEENREYTQRFYNEALHASGEAPATAEPWICDKIIEQHLHSPSMLAILPIQDWMSMNGKTRRDNPAEERINVPADAHNYWHYRMHLTVETLIADTAFNALIHDKIIRSGR